MSMARLRIRIELNRDGVGVPLHKLAGVVDETQKFFQLLGEDVQIDQCKGEWMGFDFGNESLNFTAEFVGPVSAEQVAAFHAAFDGTTSLRRATISQFARIAGAIEQNELIGFGLYLSEDGNEPTDWRCLSRRDALRITEEMELLLAASGESERESHLPAVSNSGAEARLFSDRRERGLESAKWAAYVREVEANMDRRISRVEQALDGQSGLIEDLHSKSASTEDSVRKLLTAVEGFCAQTTRQLEAMSIPLVSAATTPIVAAISDAPASESVPEAPVAGAAFEAAAVETASGAPIVAPKSETQAVEAVSEVPVMAQETAPAAEPAMVNATSAETLPDTETPAAKLLQQLPLDPPSSPVKIARRIPHSRLVTRDLGWLQKLDWRLAGGAALLVAGAIIIGVWAWQNLFSEPSVQRVAATSAPVVPPPAPAAAPAAPSPATPAPKVQTAAAKAAAPAPISAEQHVTLRASELTWVSTRNAAGTPLMARVFQKGEMLKLDLPDGATLRVGNAGGLSILLNGNSIGAIGKHGEVREVVFANGSFKVGAAN
jgi:hypothetical protein